MNLGAMVALGVDPSVLEKELRKLPYTGWSLRFEADKRGGMSGTRCDVILNEAGSAEGVHSHAHSHGHSHGHTHDHTHEHTHDHPHTHDHEHGHSPDHLHSHDHSHGDPHDDSHGHGHEHRSFADIRAAIEGSDLSSRVKADAVACFQVLAEAEGAVHGMAPEKVQFHEVGAIDSIVDMVGAAVCWELLGIDRVVCSVLEAGGGTVDCAHGRMPVPAPATVRVLEGVSYQTGGTPYEATTPTGAALLVGKKCGFQAATNGRQIGSGIGIGQRNPPGSANVLYVSLIEESGATVSDGLEADEVLELAANIDDMTGEAVGFLCARLWETGAMDVWQTPAYFKNSRPGCVVHALVAKGNVEALESTFLRHSSTLGVRRQCWKRSKLKREIQNMDTEWGVVRVKMASGPGGLARHKFEYEDCARIASATGWSLASVEAELAKLFSGDSGQKK